MDLNRNSTGLVLSLLNAEVEVITLYPIK